jgi:hypothetical protein
MFTTGSHQRAGGGSSCMRPPAPEDGFCARGFPPDSRWTTLIHVSRQEGGQLRYAARDHHRAAPAPPGCCIRYTSRRAQAFHLSAACLQARPHSWSVRPRGEIRATPGLPKAASALSARQRARWACLTHFSDHECQSRCVTLLTVPERATAAGGPRPPDMTARARDRRNVVLRLRATFTHHLPVRSPVPALRQPGRAALDEGWRPGFPRGGKEGSRAAIT